MQKCKRMYYVILFNVQWSRKNIISFKRRVEIMFVTDNYRTGMIKINKYSVPLHLFPPIQALVLQEKEKLRKNSL